MNVRAGCAYFVDVFLPDELPCVAGVGRPGDAHVFQPAVFEIAVGDVRCFRMAEARSDRAEFCVTLADLNFAPVCAEVVGHGCDGLVGDGIEDGTTLRCEADGNVGDFFS